MALNQVKSHPVSCLCAVLHGVQHPVAELCYFCDVILWNILKDKLFYYKYLCV